MITFYKTMRCILIIFLGGIAGTLIAAAEYYSGVPPVYVLIPNMFIGFGIGIFCVIGCIKIIEE